MFLETRLELPGSAGSWSSVATRTPFDHRSGTPRKSRCTQWPAAAGSGPWRPPRRPIESRDKVLPRSEIIAKQTRGKK